MHKVNGLQTDKLLFDLGTVEVGIFPKKYRFTHCLASRAAQIFGGFLPQTPLLSLTQTVSPYQFLGP